MFDMSLGKKSSKENAIVEIFIADDQGNECCITMHLKHLSTVEVLEHQQQLGEVYQKRAQGALEHSRLLAAYVDRMQRFTQVEQSVMSPEQRVEIIELLEGDARWKDFDAEQREAAIKLTYSSQHQGVDPHQMMLSDAEHKQALSNVAREYAVTVSELHGLASWCADWIERVDGVSVDGEALQWSKMRKDERIAVLEQFTVDTLVAICTKAMRSSGLKEHQKKA